jgi:hypothetical protein
VAFKWSALAAALAVALALPAKATHLIVPGRSIGGVGLGMTQDAVQTRLGKPARVRHGMNDFGLWTEFVYPNLRVFFQGDENTTSVTTTSPVERTADGAGPGSTEQRVRARVPHVVCRTEAGIRHCLVGKLLPGHRVTDFFFRGGRVGLVTVGFVID